MFRLSAESAFEIQSMLISYVLRKSYNLFSTVNNVNNNNVKFYELNVMVTSETGCV